VVGVGSGLAAGVNRPHPWTSITRGRVIRTGATAVNRLGVRRLALVAASLVLLTCCVPAAFAMGMLAQLAAGDGQVPACEPGTGPGTSTLDILDEEQRANGRLIVEVGLAEGVPPRAWVIAVATAAQESGLRNLPHLGEVNDHDSLGLFQQRPSQQWGTPEQILDPRYAAAAFYRKLMQVSRWHELPLTEAAQAVQRSAYPDAYARHEPLAVAVVGDALPGAAAVAGSDPELGCAGWDDVTTAGWTRPAEGPVWAGFRTASRPEHYGIDIGAARGAPVRAASDGTVTLVTCNAGRRGEPYGCDVDGGDDVTGCGWYVDLLHPGDVVTRYCHLGRRPSVEPGQRVAAGQAIGLVGSSGNSTGPHLHFEVELRGGGQRRQTDPVAFLADRGVTFACTGPVADCQPVMGDRVRVA
jgi:murein DD-endopeptidase MepM/ murein hydrolase activator NlpD